MKPVTDHHLIGPNEMHWHSLSIVKSLATIEKLGDALEAKV
jgi:hypothetical protein